MKSFDNCEVIIENWIGSVKHYLSQVQKDFIDKDMVFIIEAQVFMTYTEPTRKLCTVVGSFLSGQVPIAFHDSTKLYVLLIS